MLGTLKTEIYKKSKKNKFMALEKEGKNPS